MADLNLGELRVVGSPAGWEVVEVVRANGVDMDVGLGWHRKKALAIKHVTRLIRSFGEAA